MADPGSREPIPAPASRSEQAATAILVLAITALAAVLRFHALGEDSLWRDEASSWLEAHGSLADILTATARDNYPPLHNLLLAVSMHFFGDREWALRLPSAILGVLNVLALYWVGSTVGGRLAGLFAALFLALSPFHVWYSQEARMYTLLALAATLYAGTALWLCRKATVPRAVACIAAGTALLYSHLYGSFTWLAITIPITVMIARAPSPDGVRLRTWLALQAIIAILFAPWAVILLQRAIIVHQLGFWIPYPTPAIILEELTKLTSGRVALAFLVIAGALALLVGRGSTRGPLSAGHRPTWPELAVIAAWCLGPIVIGIAISALTTPVFYSRYVIASLPAAALLAGIGCASLVAGWASLAAVAAIAGAVSFYAFTTGGPGPREEWRAVSAFLAARLAPGTCVLTDEYIQVKMIAYYHPDPSACVLAADALPPDKSIPPGPSGIATSRVFALMVWGDRKAIAALPTPPWTPGGPPTEFGVIRIVPMARTPAG
ncbi:MAG: glycosyltransferase family 39 protein [Bauldia sp.]